MPPSEPNKMLTGAATVFTVRDIAASIAHYRDVLGFDVTFEYGKPTFYACLCREDVALHLIDANKTERLPGNGAICIFVGDVDKLYGELRDRKARVVKEPQTYPYGMRDFDVLDPDGNQLVFGMEAEPAKA
ncbi:MAG TPA: VOC family protein [Dongiaceae bacterium]|jgi:catechol 2,3-dioxygenase-like lactoylglutathione lyase family enzyme